MLHHVFFLKFLWKEVSNSIFVFNSLMLQKIGKCKKVCNKGKYGGDILGG